VLRAEYDAAAAARRAVAQRVADAGRNATTATGATPPIIVHMHVHKSGGMAFVKLIESLKLAMIEAYEPCRGRHRGEPCMAAGVRGRCCWPQRSAEQRAQWAAQRGARVVHVEWDGVASDDAARDITARGKLAHFITLRDPLQRLLSHAEHFMVDARARYNASLESLEWILFNKPWSAAELATRQLVGERQDAFVASRGARPLTCDDHVTARRALVQFAAVTLLGFAQHVAPLIACRLGLPRVALEHHHRASWPGSARARRTLVERHQRWALATQPLDYLVYYDALQVMQWQIDDALRDAQCASHVAAAGATNATAQFDAARGAIAAEQRRVHDLLEHTREQCRASPSSVAATTAATASTAAVVAAGDAADAMFERGVATLRSALDTMRRRTAELEDELGDVRRELADLRTELARSTV